MRPCRGASVASVKTHLPGVGNNTNGRIITTGEVLPLGGASPTPGFKAWRSYSGKTGTQNIWLWPMGLAYRSHRAVGSRPSLKGTCAFSQRQSQHRGNDPKGGLDTSPDLGGSDTQYQEATGTPPENTDAGSSHFGGSFLLRGTDAGRHDFGISLLAYQHQGLNPHKETPVLSSQPHWGHSPTHQQAGGLHMRQDLIAS